MKTEKLIEFLAKGAPPAERPRLAMRMGLTLIVGLCIAATLVIIGLGVRPDIGAARMPVMMKALFSAAAAAALLPLVARLTRPGRPLGWRIAAVFAFAGVCALAALIALMGEDPAERMHALTGGNFPWCVVLIPVLAAPTAAGITMLMRAFAPTQIGLTGAAIGALSGGVGAIAYSMYCPTDSVAFVTVWYALAIGVCAALGAIIGARFLRW